MEEEQFGDFNGDGSYDSLNDSTMGAMSDMVQSMAATIYGEFERLISTYGDNVVEGLMPQLVGVLENWDRSIKEKQEIQLELDLTKEDNETLLSQYEKEKQLRKTADMRNIEIEDAIEEQKRDLQSKLDHVSTNCKLLEVKSKNYQDQVSRLEEKDTQTKTDYDKLHDRYTELFKSHMEMMERTKAMMASEKSEADSDTRTSSRSVIRSSGGNFVAPPTPDTDAAPSVVSTNDNTEQSNNTSSAGEQNTSRTEFRDGGAGGNLALSLEAAVFDELESEGDMMTGMTKEVENLIKENQELIQTKNALNVVKDDLIGQLDELTGTVELMKSELHQVKNEKTALGEKCSGMETEMKELQQKQAALANQETEEDIPRAQRKRFTRAEMARVLMERNQYKERLMELQEAVRWTEMIRASKENPKDEQNQKKKSGLWSLFGDLFSGNKNKKANLPSATIHYNAPSTHLQPVGDPNKPRRTTEIGQDKARAFDFLQEDALTEQSRKQREVERSEQYKQVQAHVRKDDGRVQAYSWSVPTKSLDHRTGSISVPVPVYCRPLEVSSENIAERTNLWCAAAVYRCSGRTRDGGSLVGANSLFYSDSETTADNSELSESPKLNELSKELSEHREALMDSTDVTKMTSLVWLCTTCGRDSTIQVINASNPSEILESITIANAHILTIAAIPGITEKDYPEESASHDCLPSEQVQGDTGSEHEPVDVKFVTATVSNSDTSTHEYESLSDRLNSAETSYDNSQSTSSEEITRKLMLPTMWIGLQNGMLLIHSSYNEWKEPIKTIDLGDCILCLKHVGGKIFAGLANGTLVVFHRNSDGAWCFSDYHIIDLGQEKVPIRTITGVGRSNLWIGHKNNIFILDTQKLQIVKQFTADERSDTQVRLMDWSGDGVWVAIRNEPVLHLYHAYNTELLQDINIQSCVDKLIGLDKPGLTRVTALEISCNRLWIGTGNGVIISLPLTIENLQDTSKAVDIPGRDPAPGGLVRVYCDKQGDRVTPASFVPYCDLSNAQLSFHGHRDCVRFITTISSSSKETNLVMSGGDGYVDFRFETEGDEQTPDPHSPSFWSHLIVWETSNQLQTP